MSLRTFSSYWAVRGEDKVGPCETREDAVAKFRLVFPIPDDEPCSRHSDIMTGYGTYGPHFNIQWSKAREDKS